jgi:cold shock protein
MWLHRDAWRVTFVGTNWVRVAAGRREVAERCAMNILAEGMYPDQSPRIVAAVQRLGVCYVQAELAPFPSTCDFVLAEGSASAEREAAESFVTRHRSAPTEWAEPAFIAKAAGRMYLGQVKWFSEERGFGFIDCEDRRLGEIFVHSSDVCNVGLTVLSSGQDVSFYLQATAAGFRATSVLALLRSSDA